MPKFGPIKRTKLIHCLRILGFSGPFSGGKHQYMIKGNNSLSIPNPHQGDIGGKLLSKILQQGNISKSDWEDI